MLLPLRHVWTLRISVAQKLALVCLFSLGVVVVAIAIIRLYDVTKATSEGAVDETKLADAPLILSLWSQIEAAVSVIVANLPSLRSFMHRRPGGPKYGSQESDISSGSSSDASKRIYQVHHMGKMDTVSRSKSAIRHQSVELESLDDKEDEARPTTGKAIAMPDTTDRVVAMKSIEAGDAGILATTEVSVTSSPRTDQHRREDLGWNTFGLRLRPDLT